MDLLSKIAYIMNIIYIILAFLFIIGFIMGLLGVVGGNPEMGLIFFSFPVVIFPHFSKIAIAIFVFFCVNACVKCLLCLINPNKQKLNMLFLKDNNNSNNVQKEIGVSDNYPIESILNKEIPKEAFKKGISYAIYISISLLIIFIYQKSF